jgi:hypothetical protein
MVHEFDPINFNGTIFSIDIDDKKSKMSGDWLEYRRQNKPVPASFFPKTLTFDGASAALPDMFHTSRAFIIFSERARMVMEEWAPGQVEFIPVALQARPKIAAQLKLASAYYFINVLGRAQRLQWLEMPTQQFPTRKDGTEPFGILPDRRDWKLRERAAGEPLIWHDNPWCVENRRYSGSSIAFIEDVLWRELDVKFPDQLHALRVGE